MTKTGHTRNISLPLPIDLPTIDVKFTIHNGTLMAKSSTKILNWILSSRYFDKKKQNRKYFQHREEIPASQWARVDAVNDNK